MADDSDNDNSTTKKLTVQSLRQSDAARNLAAISDDAADELGVESGDYVTIKGDDGHIVSRVWPGYDDDSGRDIIRVDGRVRQQIGAGIGENVEVEKAEVSPADQIEIALPSQFSLRGAEPMFRDRLQKQPVEEGMDISIPLSVAGGPNQQVPAKIIGTQPDGAVVVTEKTQIVISDKPLEQVAQQQDNTPDVQYEDIGGLDKELEKVREMIELPMRHSELFSHLGIDPPKGVLLHGPPGTGKTLMAQAVANEVDADFFDISGPEIMSRFYGQSEEELREIFAEAEENSPAIIFIDEIDSIAPSRDESGDVERRIVAQLLSLMDGLEERGEVVVIGATNRVDAIDNALRRGGRFDREIEIGVPDEEGRQEILDIHTRGMPLADEIDLEGYAEKTYGFVGADLASLTREAAMNAIQRVRPEIDLEEEEIDAEVLQSIKVTQEDFKQAMKGVEPSALREVFVSTPDVTWNDVGGLKETKDRLQETVEWPLDYPQVFADMDVEAANGVLLYGPPGTGKTMLAKAVANESDSNFISIKGPELLNKYVGESEKGVREVFQKARENAPTVVFFDEIDAIAAERGSRNDTSGVGERVVSQILTELDGLEALEDVVVIATSNRPDLIDSALMRPGRLDRHIHVPVPDLEARRKVFEVHTRSKKLADGVDLDELAERTEGYVGADIEAVCREAAMNATRRVVRNYSPEEVEEGDYEEKVTMEDFEQAISEVTASVDEEMEERYNEIEERMNREEPNQPERKGRLGFQ